MVPSEENPGPDGLGALLDDSDWLRRLSRSLVKDVQRAEDAVQDTWLAALQRPAGAGRVGRGWMASVLRNFVRQSHRSSARRSAREDHAGRERASNSAPPSGEIAERLELQRRVVEAVQALEEPYRTALVLRFFDGHAPREVAKRTGAPVKTVHTRIDRGLAKLRVRLDRDYGGERKAWAAILLPLVEPGALATAASIILTAKFLGVAAVAALSVVAWKAAAPAAPEIDVPAVAPEVFDDESTPETGPIPERIDERREVARPPVTASAERPVATTPVEVSATASLLVRVVKRDTGEPVVGVNVSFQGRERSGGTAASFYEGATTDQSGRARIEVPAGSEGSLTVHGRFDSEDPVDRETTIVEPLAAGELREITVQAKHGFDAEFFARVTDGESGLALEDVRVLPTWAIRGGTILPAKESGRDVMLPSEVPGLALLSDELGEFSLPFATWERHGIRLTHAGYGPAFVELRAENAGPERRFEAILTRSASLEAEVILVGATGEPLTVRLSVEPDDLAQPVGARVPGHAMVWEGVCDVAGRVRFDGLPARAPVEVVVRQADELVWRSPSMLRIEPGEHRVLELVLGAGTRISGRLVDEQGAGISDQEIWVLPVGEREADRRRGRLFEADDVRHIAALARTDLDGGFVVEGIPPGSWWVGAAARRRRHSELHVPADSVAPYGELVQVGDDVRETFVEVKTARGLYISGRVEGHTGSLSTWAYATPTSLAGQAVGPVQADGTFAIGPLVPGHYKVTSKLPDSVWTALSVRARGGEKDVVITSESGIVVSGRVVDERGEPQDARVGLVRVQGSRTMGTGTHGKGQFSFTNTAPDEYVLTAASQDGRFAVLDGIHLAQGDRVEDIELVLADGARVQLSLEGVRESVRCNLISGGALLTDFTLRRGKPTIETIPPGPLLVRLYVVEQSGRVVLGEKSVNPAAGELASVSFDVVR